MDAEPIHMRLDWLLAAARDPMLVCDAAGVIVRANAPLAALFGWPLDELVGEPVEILVPPAARARHAVRRAMSGAARAMGEGRFTAIDRDGNDVPVEVSLAQLEADGVRLTLATVHDLRARLGAEQALRDSEARMRAVFETAADGILTIDERGLIERVNPAAERMFGWTEAELVGRNVATLMPSPDRERHDGYLRNYLRTGERRIIGKGREVFGLRRDGTVFPLELAVTEMHIGQSRMFTGLVRDITARKEAERQAALLLQELRAANEELGNFAYVVSHDLKAPLRELAAHQERIREGERQRIAREIHDELGGLLTGIKAYISVVAERCAQAGQAPDPLLGETAVLAQEAIDTVRRVIVDLRPSVLDQLGIWASLEWYAGQVAQRSGLACTCEIAPAAAALAIDADRSIMLFRIVQEAMTNVQRHARAKTVALRAGIDAGRLRITIEDDGCGYGADGGNADGPSWGILGMQERSRSLGGDLTLAPRPGGGTVVTLSVPVGEHDVV